MLNVQKREKNDFLRKKRILNKVLIVSIFPKSSSIQKLYKIRILFFWRCRKVKEDVDCAKFKFLPSRGEERCFSKRKKKGKKEKRFFKKRENLEQSFNNFNFPQIFIHPQKLCKIRILFSGGAERWKRTLIVQNSNSFFLEVENVAFLKGKKEKKRFFSSISKNYTKFEFLPEVKKVAFLKGKKEKRMIF